MDAKTFIQEKGWGVCEQVAKAAGTNRAYFSQIAHGHKNASVELAGKLVKASDGELDFFSLVYSTPRRRAVVGE